MKLNLRKYLRHIIPILISMSSFNVDAEIIKLKCTGTSYMGNRKIISIHLINTTQGTVNNEKYAILDVTDKMITWQKNNATSAADQLPLVEINRSTGIMHLTWSDGEEQDSDRCKEF